MENTNNGLYNKNSAEKYRRAPLQTLNCQLGNDLPGTICAAISLRGKTQIEETEIAPYSSLTSASLYMPEYLLETERAPLGLPLIAINKRACMINWLMKLSGRIYGNPAVVQTACWYFDSYFAGTLVPTEMKHVQVIGAASLWIAQKLHGPQTAAIYIVNLAKNRFTKSDIIEAEKKLLMDLRFPSLPVIPHDFITFFAWLCDKDCAAQIELAATFLCMSGLMVTKELCEVLPSVIACAAIKTAVTLLGESTTMPTLMQCPAYAVTEQLSCFSRTCRILENAARTVGIPDYSNKAPLNRYGTASKLIAEKVIRAMDNYVHS